MTFAVGTAEKESFQMIALHGFACNWQITDWTTSKLCYQKWVNNAK